VLAAFAWRFLLSLGVMSAVVAGLAYSSRALLFHVPPEIYYARGMSIEVPRNWGCRTESTEIVCDPPGSPPYDATIIATAKTADGRDTLDTYMAHLRIPQKTAAVDGTPHVSAVIDVQVATYSTQRWVDSLHRGSELPNYDTRYLATVIGATAILITFSCHRRSCESYQPLLTRFVSSIGVRGTPQ
jgi:hypothetical protein